MKSDLVLAWNKCHTRMEPDLEKGSKMETKSEVHGNNVK